MLRAAPAKRRKGDREARSGGVVFRCARGGLADPVTPYTQSANVHVEVDALSLMRQDTPDARFVVVARKRFKKK